METLALTVKPKPVFSSDGVACDGAQSTPWALKHDGNRNAREAQ